MEYNIQLKNTRIFIIAIGIIKVFFCLFTLLIALVQKRMIASFTDDIPPDAGLDIFWNIHEIMFTYLPLVIIIGILQGIFGWKLYQLFNQRILIHVGITLIYFLIILLYSNAASNVFNDLMDNFPGEEFGFNIIFFSQVFNIIFYSIPEIIILYFLYTIKELYSTSPSNKPI